MPFLDLSRFNSMFTVKTGQASETPAPAAPATQIAPDPDQEQIAIEADLQKVLEKSTEWGDRLQKAKADEKALIAEKSWLSKFPWKEKPAEIDNRFLAILSGDAFIKDTPLEGYAFDESMAHYIDFFEMLLRHKDSPEVKEFEPYFPKIQSYLDQLKACKTISERTHKIMDAGLSADAATRTKLVKDYAEELSREFAKGGMDWFPTGWVDTSSGGHAMLLKIEKNGNIAFINSGGGLEYHSLVDVTSPAETSRNIKSRAQQFLTLKGNNKERLGSVEFFRFLLEVNVCPVWDGSFKPEASIIYEGLFQYLGGTKESGYDPKKQAHLFKTPQRSGTCAAKSISTGFYYHLCGIFGGTEKDPKQAVKAYKKIKFLWERQALISRCSQIPTKDQLQGDQVMEFNPSLEYLLEDIMKNMGREAESLYEDKQFSSDEMLSLHATFLDIRNRTSAIKERHSKMLSETLHCERDYRVPIISTDLKTNIPSPTENELIPEVDGGGIDAPFIELSKNIMATRIDPLTEPVKASETLKNWLKTIEPILSQKEIKEELNYGGQNKDFAKVILNYFEDILCHMPIPNHDKNLSFWQHIPEDQILECMRSLKLMMTMLNLASNVHSDARACATLTTNYAFLAIMDQLARRLPESKLKNQPINYYELLAKIKSPYFINPDPKIQEQLTKVLKYFDPSLSIDNAYHLDDRILTQLSKKSIFNFNTEGGSGPRLTIDNDALQKNPTVKYLRQFLQWDNPLTRDKLLAKKITPGHSLLEQLKLMLWVKKSDIKEESVLPESVELLQQAALHCTIACNKKQIRNRAILSYDSAIQSFDQLPNFVFEDERCYIEGKDSESMSWYGNDQDTTRLLESPLTIDKKKKNKKDSDPVLAPQVTLAQTALQKFYARYHPKEESGKCEAELHVLLRNEHERVTQNAIIHVGKRYFDLNFEDSHELAMLGADPYDEVNRTLSFAQRHVALLNKEHFQDLIYIHLFKHGRMLSQFKDSSQYTDQMVEFLEEAMDYYVKAADPKTCLYLAKIGHMMQDFAKKSGITPKKPFPDFYSIILDTLIPLMKEPSLIKQSCEMIVKCHIPSREDSKAGPETLKKIAEAVILTSLSARLQTQKLSEGSDLGLDLVTRNIQQYWHPLIKTMMGDDKVACDKILNHALSMIIEGVNVSEWDGEYPHYRSGIYEIDVQTGIAKKNGNVLVTLPDNIVRHDDFRRLKIQTISHVTRKDESTYIIYPDEIEVTNKYPDIEIRKTIDGNRYRYFSRLKDLGSTYPTLFNNETDFWIYDRNNSYCLAFNAGKNPIKINLNKSALNKLFVGSIEQGEREWVAFKTLPESLQKVINVVESENKYIECWRTKNKPSSLDAFSITRLGLNFDVRQEENKTLAFCQEFPGFFVAESRFVGDSLNENDPYIVLENSAGEKKVIFPKLPLSFKVASSKDGKSYLGRELIKEIPENHSKEWMEYSIQEGELHSSFIGPRLYSALIYLPKGNYAKANNILKHLNCTAAFTKKDIDTLVTMSHLLIKDKHPAAQAILLSIFALYEENKLKFPPSVGTKNEYLFPFKDLYEAYIAYVPSVGNIPTYRLSEEQEKCILTQGKNYLVSQIKKNKDDQQSKALLAQISGYLNDFISRSSVMGPVPKQVGLNKKESSSEGSYWLQTYVEGYSLPVESPKFSYESALMKDSSKLRGEFVAFYDIALRGSAEEKKKLVAFLDLQKGNIKSDDQQVYKLLKTVCRYPLCYPKIPVLKQAIAKKRASDKWEMMDECNKVFNKVVNNKLTYLFNKITGLIPGIFNVLGAIFSKMLIISNKFKWRQRWKALDDGKILKSTLLILNGKPLEDIDQSFNRYFKKVIDTYFVYEDLPVEPIAPHLPVDHADPLVKEKLKQENADLDAFDKMRSKVRRVYTIRPGVDLKKMEAALDLEVKRWEGTLKTQQQALIWQANCMAWGKDPHKLKAIHKDANQEKVTWQDIQDSFCKGTLEAFQKKMFLNQDEVRRLFQGVADYSLKKNRLEQTKHVINALTAYEKSAVEAKKEEDASAQPPAPQAQARTMWPFGQSQRKVAEGIVSEKEQKEKAYKLEEAQAKKTLFLQQVVTALSLFPAYELKTENRSEMLFEMANRYFFRKEQIEKHAEIIKNLKFYPEMLAQMRTGYGKTKTMVPRGDIELAEQGNLVVNLWPESLETTNTQDVKAQLEKSFAREVDAMKFDRSTELTEENLQKRYSELQKDIKEGRPLNIRPETIRALEAHLILMLNECHSKQVDSNLYQKQLEYLLKIHHLTRVATVAFIDEAKHNLAPGEDLIYTLGRSKLLPKSDVDLIEEMHLILSESPFKELLDIENNNQPLLSRKDFDEKIALELTKIFEKKWGVTSQQSEEFRSYILGEQRETPAWLKTHPNLSQISLLRGNLLFILPVACKGYVDQQFGLSKKHISTKEFAIPYVSANTPKETDRAPSECKNPHEALIKTYITYLEKGLSEKQLVKLIELLKDLAFKETGVGVTFDNTPANQFFKKICPHSKKPLNTLNIDDILELYPELRHNKQAIFYYIRCIVVPQIVYYPKTIASTTQNLRSQFSRSISLTATPQDTGAHGPDTFFLPVKGTAGQVTHVLYTKCKEPQTIQQLNATTSRELLKETQALIGNDPSMHATVDVGALYKGITNRALAEQTCENLRNTRANVEAVVFFDDNADMQKFMVMDVRNGQVGPLDGCSLDPAKRYTIYDQHRTYGSDIPQAFSAKGLILLSPETTKSEAAQGWGRFRQGDKILDGQIKGQSPVFAMPRHMGKEVFGPKDPNISDLLIHLVANEAIDSAEFNYEALKEQMDNEIRRALLDKIEGVKIGEASKGLMTDPKQIQVDVSNALKLFSYFEKDLIKEENFDPILLYSTTPKAEETIGFLKIHQARCIEKVKKCRGLTAAEKQFITARLQKYSSKWSGQEDSLSLPKEVKATSSALGLSCEVFNEVETEVQIKTQIEVQGTDVLRTPAVWKESMDLYKAGWERPSSTRFTILSKLTAKVSNVARRILKAWDNMDYLKKETISIAATFVAFIGVEIVINGIFALSLTLMSYSLPFLIPAATVLALSSQDMIVQTRAWKWISTTRCRNYRLKEVLGAHLPSKVSKAIQLFNPNFLASDNFYRQNTLGILEPIQSVLDNEQKPLFEVLVIQDEVRGKKQVQFMALDQNDSQYFRRRFQKDQDTESESASKRTRKLAVVDVRSGRIVAQGKNCFKDDELVNNPDYNSLMAQAKVLDGGILYTEAEQAQLKTSVNKVGQDVMRRFFEDYILPLHPVNKHCYVNKPIAQILGKVAA